MNLPNLLSRITGIFLITFTISCNNQSPKAELIVTNANIWTGNNGQPRAQAMAISGDSILAVGSKEEIDSYKGAETVIVDANSKFIVPGFIDTHVHFAEGGLNLSWVKLRDASSPEDFSQRIKKFSQTVPEGTWILGGEWDGKTWGVLPSKELIDSLTSKHPVFVTRLDGHIAVANTLALSLAGIDSDIENVPGGVIDRDSNNNLTGVLRDNAMNLVTDKIPAPSDEMFDQAIDNAMDYMVSNGVTSVHNVWYPTDFKGHPEAFLRAKKDGRMKVRIYDHRALIDWQQQADRVKAEGNGDKWLKTDGLKGVFDGALGSHTAFFMEPYSDSPEDYGLLMFPEEDLKNWVNEATNANLNVTIHAIGDRAINITLNAFEKIQTDRKDVRFRIEHAQHINSSDIPRFASLNVIPSMQPYHAIDDGRWAEEVIGSERINEMYAFKSLMDAGAKVAFGSDWPVAPASPLWGIYAATTRRTLDGKNPDGWVPQEKITIEQALTAYTINGAYASFEENIKGSIEPGKMADFIILSDNLFEIDPVQIKDVKVLQTFVGGKNVYTNVD